MSMERPAPSARGIQPLIRLEALAREYRRGDSVVRALGGVDLDIERGDFVAITGRSGSGKSTMLQLLGTLDRPTGGRYFLDGVDVFALDDRRLAKLRSRRIGFVFQTFHLLEGLSVLDNVLLPFAYRDESRRTADGLARAALERVGLGHRLDHTPAALSGGEMQRTAIARALALAPDIILADEPTGNLDEETSEGILELFGELHREGATLLMVTHDGDVAARATRRVRMVDGRLTEPASAGLLGGAP